MYTRFILFYSVSKLVQFKRGKARNSSFEDPPVCKKYLTYQNNKVNYYSATMKKGTFRRHYFSVITIIRHIQMPSDVHGSSCETEKLVAGSSRHPKEQQKTKICGTCYRSSATFLTPDTSSFCLPSDRGCCSLQSCHLGCVMLQLSSRG